MMNYDEQKLRINDALYRLELEIDESIVFIDNKVVRKTFIHEL